MKTIQIERELLINLIENTREYYNLIYTLAEYNKRKQKKLELDLRKAEILFKEEKEK